MTICVLTFGDHPNLARRVLDSIRLNCPRTHHKLVVGANSVGEETSRLLNERQRAGEIDELIFSATNLFKCAMMRLMFDRVETEYVWWFDDDSYVLEGDAFARWLGAANESSPSVAMWGDVGWCDQTLAFTDMDDVLGFVRSAAWYRGMPPPSWRPGGKGELNFDGRGTGDGRWFFVFGGCWMMRTSAIRALDWPDRRLIQLGDDVFLGEAIRQQGWTLAHIGALGVAIDTEPRRGQGPGVSSASLANFARGSGNRNPVSHDL